MRHYSIPVTREPCEPRLPGPSARPAEPPPEIRLVRAGNGSNGKPLYRKPGGRTINRTVTNLMRRIMLKAKQRWQVDIPNMPIWSDHLQQVDANTPRVVTLAEQERLDESERPWLRPIREFVTLTGLRLTECASLVLV